MKNNISKYAINYLSGKMYKSLSEWDYLSSLSGEGPIKDFESSFLEYSGGKYAIAMTNCTSALLVSMLALDINPGDEVILPSYTWGQTLSPVLMCGAKPIFADITRQSFSISPKEVEKLITKKTKAIIAVNLFGFTANLDALSKISRKYNLKLIMDSAQSFGSIYNGKLSGNFGDFVAFSFGRSKFLSLGEGGMLVCNDKNLFEKAVFLSQHPLRAHKQIDNKILRNSINGINLNFRLHPFIALLGLGQLKYFNNNKIIEKNRMIIKEFYNLISNNNFTTILPREANDCLPLCTSVPLFSSNNNLLKILRKLNINSEFLYETCFNPLHEYYYNRKIKLSNTDSLIKNKLSFLKIIFNHNLL